jgi:hypothetical protein
VDWHHWTLLLLAIGLFPFWGFYVAKLATMGFLKGLEAYKRFRGNED